MRWSTGILRKLTMAGEMIDDWRLEERCREEVKKCEELSVYLTPMSELPLNLLSRPTPNSFLFSVVSITTMISQNLPLRTHQSLLVCPVA